jgi:hypothetical protein
LRGDAIYLNINKVLQKDGVPERESGHGKFCPIVLELRLMELRHIEALEQKLVWFGGHFLGICCESIAIAKAVCDVEKDA